MTPQDKRLARALSNYLRISHNADRYASVAGYLQAEEEAWNVLMAARAAQSDSAPVARESASSVLP